MGNLSLAVNPTPNGCFVQKYGGGRVNYNNVLSGYHLYNTLSQAVYKLSLQRSCRVLQIIIYILTCHALSTLAIQTRDVNMNVKRMLCGVLMVYLLFSKGFQGFHAL